MKRSGCSCSITNATNRGDVASAAGTVRLKNQLFFNRLTVVEYHEDFVWFAGSPESQIQPSWD